MQVFINPLISTPNFTDTLINLGDQIVLGASIQGGSGNYLFEWMPTTELSDPFDLYTTASPLDTQLFILSITDLSDSECTEVVSINVNVTEEISIDDIFYIIPTAFSPNEDGLNDFFFPLFSEDVINVESLKIFNRWGDLVHDLSIPWDGKYNGELQPIGGYAYITQFNLLDNKRLTVSGTFSLIR